MSNRNKPATAGGDQQYENPDLLTIYLMLVTFGILLRNILLRIVTLINKSKELYKAATLVSAPGQKTRKKNQAPEITQIMFIKDGYQLPNSTAARVTFK